MITTAQIEKLLKENAHHECVPKCERPCVRIEAIAKLPSRYGQFHVVAFSNTKDTKEHVAFVHGDVLNKKSVPVRIHSECVTGDIAWSLRCDCHDQLVAALKRIGKMKNGIVLYLRQEGRGIGLVNKIKAYMLQDRGLDTFEANQALGFRDDERDFSIAAHMLRALHVQSVQLMTNNPDKIRSLQEWGITVTKRIPLSVRTTKHNEFYLETKEQKAGHLLGHTHPHPSSQRRGKPPLTSP